VTEIPEFVGGRATYVGEVMMLRPRPDIVDPLLLLAFMRSPAAVTALQRMTRGQTAHLMPDDVGNLRVPTSLLVTNGRTSEIRNLLAEEGALALRRCSVATRLDDLIRGWDTDVKRTPSPSATGIDRADSPTPDP
jgi:type I restriction enzyme M protein